MIFKKSNIPRSRSATPTETSITGTKQLPEADVGTEAEGSAADGEVLREIIFHFDAMQPNDDLPGY